MTKADVAFAVALRRTTAETVEFSRHDAIVVGSGAAGGLAAELLCEAGLNVLVLDAGWRVPFWQAPLRRSISNVTKIVADPRVVRSIPASIRWRAERALRALGRLRQPVQSGCYAWPTAAELFVDDRESPYETPTGKPFNWIRVHGLGGRMVVPAHGRQYLRHGYTDFRPVDGLSPPWPFEPEALNPWYELVERRLRLSGCQENSPWVPDSLLAEVREPTEIEQDFLSLLQANYPHLVPLLNRSAPPMPSLSKAAETGRLLCRQGAIVRHVELDSRGRASGVVFYDRRNRAYKRAKAPLVFVAASTLESTRILLCSQSTRTPDGIGARSGALGHFLMDHVAIGVQGIGPPLRSSAGSRDFSDCIYLPRFDLRHGYGNKTSRGFDVRVYQSSHAFGSSYFVAVSVSEMLPQASNRVMLSNMKDAWGLPTLRIEALHSHNEMENARRQAEALEELAALASVRLHGPTGKPSVPGSAIHECGTARMGDDPGNSVLDPFNQAWEALGLYVTDGAAFPSEGFQNPTLTIMALTARACDHAVHSTQAKG